MSRLTSLDKYTPTIPKGRQQDLCTYYIRVRVEGDCTDGIEAYPCQVCGTCPLNTRLTEITNKLKGTNHDC
ncbi:hypothetical protein NVP1238A_77 [Vibrio phage 1.238.A._10N.261.52.F10]|uniref:Uncharacterized protein n=1 Tax=Vibrio phage 1.238.A._10N.261.52.F10 TaxID=1881231 RepID=A0A2I7RUI5_9CAUD|nr:hypothetical protein KNT79_gp77 [Vibrio phage 1.238.A._10N.261.52.F10]AUR97326.1 hypothetical protein NVP1238A_77 [Vibrio phage 1.238.A._10N.261.52.F10]AUR97420.1 hypothetical protein NVP1238B_78 [Vibrio phage 1.238.B._10N.261.52.F10]